MTKKSKEYIARVKKIKFYESRHDDFIIERALLHYVGKKEHDRDFNSRSKALLRMFLKRQENKCFYCYRELIHGDKWLMPTLDHKIPGVRGGHSNLTNICVSCGECNSKKGDMTSEEFIEFRRGKGEELKLRQEWHKERILSGEMVTVDSGV